MSEPETETQVTQEIEQEAAAAPESADDANWNAEPDEEIEGEEEDSDGYEAKVEADEAAQAVLTEKARKVREDKIDRENERHAARIGDIMADDAADLIPCPVCMDGVAGWVYAPEAAQLPDEAILRIRQLIGLSGLEGLREASFATRCPECDGQGDVKTGSRVAGYETTTCERCMKKGWIGTGTTPANGHVALEPAAIVTGPTVYEAAVEDPEIRHLQERGFTVIPPMQIQGG